MIDEATGTVCYFSVVPRESEMGGSGYSLIEGAGLSFAAMAMAMSQDGITGA